MKFALDPDTDDNFEKAGGVRCSKSPEKLLNLKKSEKIAKNSCFF